MGKQFVVRYSDKGYELVKKAAEAEGFTEVGPFIRLLMKEGLERRGYDVPEEDFDRKQEGRPKDLPTTTISDVGRQNEMVAVAPVTISP